MNFLELSGILFWIIVAFCVLVPVRLKLIKNDVVEKGIKRCVEDVN